MDPITEIFIKEEEIFQDPYIDNYIEQPPPELTAEKPVSGSNQFYQVLIKESDYVEAEDDLANVIELNSDIECISVNSDSSEDVELVSYDPPHSPESLTSLVPSVLNVRTIDSWETPVPQESLDSPAVVSEYSIDPLSGQVLNTEATGLSCLSHAARPIDYFNLFVTNDLYNMIVNETNTFGMQLMVDAKLPHARMKNFRDLTIVEFKKFLGLLYHMGNVKLSKASNYWMMGRYFHIRIFGETMGRNRFYQIMRSLNFNSQGNPKEDRLMKIRPIMDYFNNRVKMVYHVDEEFYNEELALLRAKLVYRQNKTPKKGKCEIKMYMLTDPNGLVLKFFVLGKNDRLSKETESEIIRSLREDKLPNVDSVNQENENRQCTDTAKRKSGTNHQDGNQKKFRNDETVESSSEDNEFAFKWEDTEDMLGLFLDFDDEITSKHGEEVTNPTWKSYGYVSRINLKDRMMAFYACERESLLPHVKIGLHILQLLLLNSYALYKKRTNNTLSFLRFRMNIIQELIGEHLPLPLDGTSMSSTTDSIHLPAHCPRSDKNRVLKRQCVQCKLLKRKRIESIFMCPLCPGQPGLCLENCFRDYHNYI